jgi:predicted dehydrogenase
VAPFSVGIVGLGQFGPEFVELFQRHPQVSSVSLCDTNPDRLERVGHAFGITELYSSFEELLDSDVDAVAIFTQRWMHGPMTIEALRRGKHVYSAVPMGVSVEEIEEIVSLVASTGLTYMMGETSYYYPAVVFCREKWRSGAFGDFVHGEGEYLHDMADGFYGAFEYSGGAEWKRTASFPPMLYSTHSVSGVLAVTGSHATAVSCVGFRDTGADGVFDRDVSLWDNDASNETALFVTADGGSMRINEFRRVGIAPHRPEVRFSIFGTEGAFEQQTGAAVWQTHAGWEDVRPLLTSSEVVTASAAESGVDPALQEGFRSGFAPVHDTTQLPEEFRGRHNGHEGSHQYLVNDFATAVATGALPPVNAWTAARYTVPGIVAHESAQQGGAQLAVPDFGDPGSAAVTRD